MLFHTQGKEENDKIKVSDIEFKLPTPSYSYQTIQEILKNKNKGEKVNFIIGFDAFKNIEKWKNPEDLKENIKFIVLKRTGENRLEIEKLKEEAEAAQKAAEEAQRAAEAVPDPSDHPEWKWSCYPLPVPSVWDSGRRASDCLRN